MMGKIALARSGKYISNGHSIPVGYKYNAKKDGGDATLEILPDEAEMVRYIYDLFQAGYTYLAIYRKICERYPDRRKITSSNTIKSILTNQMYLGKFHHDGEYYASADVPRIIDDDTFWRVQRKVIEYQEALVQNSLKPVRETTHPLNGFIWCGCCGQRFRYKYQIKKGSSGSALTYEFFDCQSKYRDTGVKCHQPRISIRVLEAAIWDQLEALRFDDLQSSIPDHEQEIAAINKKISSIDQRISKLIDLYALDTIDFSQIEKRTQELKDQKIRLQEQIRVLETDAADQDLDIVRDAIDRLHEIRESGTDAEKRDIYRILLKRVTIGPGNNIGIELTV